MQLKDSWLLPDGIEEILPEEAQHLENLRRKLLELFACWGYDLVIPPFIDFLDSLLTGSGHDLDLHNLHYFKQSIPWLEEVSIGHALICDAIYLGLENTIQMYKRQL